MYATILLAIPHMARANCVDSGATITCSVNDTDGHDSVGDDSGDAVTIDPAVTVERLHNTIGVPEGVFDLVGNNITITNNGTVTVTAGSTNDLIGIIVTGSSATLNNNGDINMTPIAGNPDAISFTGAGGHILSNSAAGTISGDIDLGTGDDNLTNDGSITGDINLGTGADTLDNRNILNGDITSGTGNKTLINSGAITGVTSLNSGNDNITNTGTFNGDINTGDGTDSINNSNILNSNIIFGSGNKTLINSGAINGNVTFSDGGDAFTLTNTGVIGGNVSMGTGDDIATFDVGNAGFIGILDGGGGNDTLQLTGNGTLNISATTSGFESLTANAGSNATLTGSVTFNSITIANTGRINNSASNFNVTGALINNGTLSGGAGSPQIVTNTYTQTATASLRQSVQIGQPFTVGNRVTATGVANIDGNITLNTSGGFVGNSSVGDQYTLLQSAALTGNFASVTNNLPFNWNVIYNGTDVILELQSFSTTCATSQSRSVQNMCGAINNTSTSLSPALQQVMSDISNLTATQQEQAFLQLTAEPYLAHSRTAISYNDNFTSTIHRSLDGRYWKREHDPVWGQNLWFEKNHQNFDAEDNATSLGYKSNSSYNLTFGYDKRVDDEWIFGLAFEYAESDTSWDLMPQNTSASRFFQSSFYARNMMDFADITMIASFQHANHDTTRRQQFGATNHTSTGDYNSHAIAADMRVNINAFKGERFSVTPYAGVGFVYYEQSGFTETGTNPALTLTVDDFDTSALKTEIGMEISGKIDTELVDFIPSMRVGAQQFFGADDGLSAHFTDSPTTQFDSHTHDDKQLKLKIGGGMKAMFNDNMSWYIDHDYTSYDGDAEAHVTTIGVKITW